MTQAHADRHDASRARQTRAVEALGTLITGSLEELLDVLPDLTADARQLGGDVTGWDEVGPGGGFNTKLPPPLRGSEDYAVT